MHCNLPICCRDGGGRLGPFVHIYFIVLVTPCAVGQPPWSRGLSQTLQLKAPHAPQWHNAAGSKGRRSNADTVGARPWLRARTSARHSTQSLPDPFPRRIHHPIRIGGGANNFVMALSGLHDASRVQATAARSRRRCPAIAPPEDGSRKARRTPPESQKPADEAGADAGRESIKRPLPSPRQC